MVSSNQRYAATRNPITLAMIPSGEALVVDRVWRSGARALAAFVRHGIWAAGHLRGGARLRKGSLTIARLLVSGFVPTSNSPTTRLLPECAEEGRSGRDPRG